MFSLDINKPYFFGYKKFLYLSLFIIGLYLMLIPFVFASGWTSHPAMHANIELFNALISFTAGLIILIYFGFIFIKDKFYLLLGLAFFIAGIIDLINTLFIFEANVGCVQTCSFVFWNPILALVIFAAVLFKNLNKKNKISFTLRSILLISAILLSILYLYSPHFSFSGQLISRPINLLFAVIFFAGFCLILSQIKKTKNFFMGMLLLYLLINTWGQIFMAFSQNINDIFAFVAHWSNVASNILLVIGISIQCLEEMKKSVDAEAKVRAAYDELNQIINTGAEGLRIIDINHNVIRVNEEFLSIVEMKESEVIGSKCHETFGGENCFSPRCTLARIKRGEIRVECEIEKVHSDGKKIPYSLVAKPYVNLEGELIGILEDFRDISKLKRVEAELRRSNEELEQFAYIASHDLQSPIRQIASYTELLSRNCKGMLDKKTAKYMQYIIEGSKRMQKLVNDLLAYSRVNRSDPSLEKTDLQSCVETILRQIEYNIRDRNAIVTYKDLPVVYVNKLELEQVLQNLIVNAIKFNTRDKPSVHISAYRGNKRWIISVQDNGIGIEEKYMKKIFGIFKRLHTRDEYPGTGIGLSICKKIIERHDGEIWVESQIGKGSTFYFSLPASN